VRNESTAWYFAFQERNQVWTCGPRPRYIFVCFFSIILSWADAVSDAQRAILADDAAVAIPLARLAENRPSQKTAGRLERPVVGSIRWQSGYRSATVGLATHRPNGTKNRRHRYRFCRLYGATTEPPIGRPERHRQRPSCRPPCRPESCRSTRRTKNRCRHAARRPVHGSFRAKLWFFSFRLCYHYHPVRRPFVLVVLVDHHPSSSAAMVAMVAVAAPNNSLARPWFGSRTRPGALVAS
jgi:hypothetical protein